MKHNRGVTTIEILVSICIIAIVLALLFALLIDVRKEDNSNNIQSNFIINQSSFIKTIEEDMINYGVKSVSSCTLSDAGIESSTFDNRFNQKCIRIEYATDYIKDNIGYLMVYKYYRHYDKKGDKLEGKDEAIMIQYVRGSYTKCNSATSTYEQNSFKNATSLMKEIPSEIEDIAPYIDYTAASSTYNAASLVLPIKTKAGEHYDINLSFTFNSNNNFKCYQKDNKLSCNCRSNNSNCNLTKITNNYSNSCR